MKKTPIENDPELWDLLGKAKPPEIPPFFARNVLREVRAARREPLPLRDRISVFFRGTAKTAALACGAVLAGGIFFFSQLADRPEPVVLTDAPQAVSEELVELEIILALEDLIAMEENSLWLDTY